MSMFQKPPEFYTGGIIIYDPIKQLMHAFSVCLNAVYHNQVEVKVYEDLKCAAWQWVFKIGHSHYIKFSMNSEFLYDLDCSDTAFSETIKQICDQFDDAQVLYEMKTPDFRNLWASKDVDPNEAFTIDKVPVKDSYLKLQKAGIVEGVSMALFKKHDVSTLTVEMLMEALKQTLKQSDQALKNFDTKFQLWVKQMESVNQFGYGYGDSGYILKKKFPGLSEIVEFPCACVGHGSVHDVIIHLNDLRRHGKTQGEWTREQIADWLESLDVDLELKED